MIFITYVQLNLFFYLLKILFVMMFMMDHLYLEFLSYLLSYSLIIVIFKSFNDKMLLYTNIFKI